MCCFHQDYLDNSYLCFSSDSTKTLNFIDDYFKNWILAQGGQEYHVPALINRNVLEKCGYFSSFPQHLTVAGFVKPEFYPNVATDSEVKDEYIAMKEQYLTPAACLHIYPMLEGDNIKENTAITTLARVYRYEHGNFDGITRLWDFTVREIVFVGASDYVLRQLEKTKQLALEFTQKLGLSADIIEANDQFYPSQKNIIKAKLQKANSLKHELSLQIKEKQVAIASFNFHDTHFSKAFNFDDGGKIVTGCVGFGLERWLAVINENNIHLDKVTY